MNKNLNKIQCHALTLKGSQCKIKTNKGKFCRIHHKVNLKNTEINEDDRCVICCDPNRKPDKLSCGHEVHFSCIIKSGKKLCPFCRSDIALSKTQRKKMKQREFFLKNIENQELENELQFSYDDYESDDEESNDEESDDEESYDDTNHAMTSFLLSGEMEASYQAKMWSKGRNDYTRQEILTIGSLASGTTYDDNPFDSDNPDNWDGDEMIGFR
jgi:hypothetical protein